MEWIVSRPKAELDGVDAVERRRRKAEMVKGKEEEAKDDE